jgi:succinoglycan biosynthesis transport protein ExoP
MRSQKAVQSARQALAPLSQSGAESEESLSILDLLQSLLRHKLLIVSCVLVSLLCAGVYLTIARPVYEASASLRIDPARASSLGLSDLLSSAGAGFGTDETQTEIAIIKSDVVAIDTLKSLPDQDFQRYAHAPKTALVFSKDVASTPAAEGLLSRFKLALKVKQVEGTQLVAISFRDHDARIASLIANGAVAAYRRQSFDSRYESVAQVSDWLSAQMRTLQNRASEAQGKLAAFQEQNNILGSDPSNNTTIDRLRLLNSRLAEAQSERIVKEAQMRASQVQEPAVLASLFPDANLTSLESEKGTLYAQYAQQSVKFGPNYPPLIELSKQMAKIDSQITRSVDTARHGIREQYDAAAKTESMLQKEYDEQTGKAYQLNRQQAEYAVLQAEGTSSRALYDTLQYKLQQAGVVAGLNGVNTMLVDNARPPLSPVEPKMLAIVGLGLASGLFVGIAASLFKEAVSERIQSGEQLERVLAYPLLAVIPHLVPQNTPSLQGELASPKQITSGPLSFREPKSKGAEAYRNLRSSLQLSSMESQLKTVLVTSTLAEEGKSSTAINYAVVLAQKGARVLLIDCDLRRPSLHTYFGVHNSDGLTHMLLTPDAPDKFLTPLVGLENLKLLTAGRQVLLPAEALASHRFRELLEHWEHQFEYILLDSAPLLVVSDSLALASVADTVLLVTRYNSTPLKALTRGKNVLSRMGAHIGGVILNDVPVNTLNYGGSGEGYY